MNNLSSAQPLDLPIAVAHPLGKPFASIARSLIERLLSFDEIREIYSESLRRHAHGPFCNSVLATLDVTIEIAGRDTMNIPAQGGLVVVANHPYGAIEGMALLSLLASVRSDVRILANSILHRIPQLRDHLIFVDPFGSSDATRGNVRGIKQAMEWVEQGGVLAVFPAGEVSHVDLRRRRVVDPPWSETIARIIRRTESPVLPVFFEGRNGALFQALGLLHPRLRTVMLPRELVNKRGRSFGARIGGVIPFDRLRPLDASAMMSYLRDRTYLLAERAEPERSVPRGSSFHPSILPAIAPVSAHRLQEEITSLPRRQLLVEHRELQAWYASADQIPNGLIEIGRLRELTFREAGEGTGKEIDLDRFDRFYHHLFLWNREAREIVGAYRIGSTDHLVGWFGIDGLYTRTLFHYDSLLLERMGPALELGRSFVQPKYQKSYNPLMLLWKGIGRYVVRYPHCKTLFGPVSISNDYSTTSQRIMASFLKQQTYDNYLGPLVKARTPFRYNPKRFEKLAVTADDAGALVGEIENDGRGLPILLRQYLKLGGRLLGLNVDPDFSDVLDALICVDLTSTDHRTLERYMGKEGMESFLRYHFKERYTAPRHHGEWGRGPI